MNNTKLTCPPLTPDDILTLRGNPMAKRIEPLKNSFTPAMEEWIYYNVKENVKEMYLFKNSKLIDYQTKEAI
jgi:hypothetical protein